MYFAAKIETNNQVSINGKGRYKVIAAALVCLCKMLAGRK